MSEQNCTMTRTWTTVGEGIIDRDTVAMRIDELQWQPAGQPVSFSAGYAIRAAIRECRIPKPLAIAEGNIGPIGLYGIETRYVNGLARVYLLDLGHRCIPVASDFTPATDVEAVRS